MVDPEIEIRLFGTFAVVRRGIDVTSALPGRKGRAVLAFLALRDPEGATRAELIEIAWPDRPPHDPRANLRTLLSRIRDVLGAESFVDGDRLAFAPGVLRTDLARALEYVEAARADRDARHPRDAVVNARAAADLLDAGLLRDMDAHWIDKPRRSTESDLSEMLACIADMGSLAGGALGDEAIAAARELVERDDYLERGHAHLILALARQGERGEALRAYETIRRQLRDELGASPGPELSALHAAILRSDDAGALPRRGSDPVRPGIGQIDLPTSAIGPVNASFVGRERELAIIRGESSDGVVGPGNPHHDSRFVAVVGPPGIGKSSLVRRAAVLAGEAGETVLFGRCDDGGMVAYQPFRQMINHLVRTLPAAVADQLFGQLRGDLAVMVPGLIDGAPGREDVSDIDRAMLFDAVAQVLRQLAESVPVLVVVEDLHWADRPTQLMLRQVERSVRDLPVTFLATYRDTVTDHAEGFGELLDDLLREREIAAIVLAGLGRETVQKLCDQRAPGDASPQLVDLIHGRSGGNPLFARELLRDLLAQGGDEGDWPSAESLADWPVPDSVQQLIVRRLSGFPDAHRDLIVRAATLGNAVRPVELAAAGAVPVADALTAVEAAAAAGLMEVPRGDTGQFAFSHVLAREALLAGISRARRAQYHWENAERLEEHWSGELEQHVTELAHHRLAAAEAGIEREAAGAWVASAAAAAERQLAYEVAASLYARSLALLGDGPSQRDTRAGIMLKLAAAQWRSGRREDSRASRQGAFELAAELGDVELMVAAALGHERYFEVNVFGDDDRAMATDALDQLGDKTPMRSRLLARLSLMGHWGDDPEQAWTLAHQAVDLALELEDEEALAESLNALLFAMRVPGHSADERLAHADRLVQIARRLGNDDWRLEGEAHRLVAIVEAGRTREVRGAIERFGRIAQGVRQPFWVYYQHAWAATMAFIEGDLVRSAQLDDVATALAIGARGDAADGGAAVTVQRAVELGDAEQVADLAAKFVTDGIHDSVWQAGNVMVLAFAGRRDEALEALRELVGPDGIALSRDLLWGLGTIMLADAAITLGDPDAARQIARVLDPTPRWIVCSGRSFLLVSQRLGQLAYVLGDHESALEHLEVARQQGRELGAGLLVAWAEVEIAATLLDRGDEADRPEAEKLIVSAGDFARSRGLGLLLQRAESLVSG